MENCTEDLQLILGVIKSVINIIKFGIPILLILFGMIDLGKAVIAGKEDEMKSAQKLLIKRLIYAVAVFFVVSIVTWVMNIVPGGNDWKTCYDQVGFIIK